MSKAILEKLPEGAVVRSPGMKYKHYAPKADVTLLDGTFEQFKAYVDAHAEQNPSCLCFTGEAEKLGVPCVEYGREGDGADQAKHIFRCLRALDEQGDAVVYARCPQKDGLSMAVYNRLIPLPPFRGVTYVPALALAGAGAAPILGGGGVVPRLGWARLADHDRVSFSAFPPCSCWAPGVSAGFLEKLKAGRSLVVACGCRCLSAAGGGGGAGPPRAAPHPCGKAGSTGCRCTAVRAGWRGHRGDCGAGRV